MKRFGIILIAPDPQVDGNLICIEMETSVGLKCSYFHSFCSIFNCEQKSSHLRKTRACRAPRYASVYPALWLYYIVLLRQCNMIMKCSLFITLDFYVASLCNTCLIIDSYTWWWLEDPHYLHWLSGIFIYKLDLRNKLDFSDQVWPSGIYFLIFWPQKTQSR